MSVEHQPHNDDIVSMSAAAELIRTIDTAFAEISTNAVNATKESDDARKNARVASEIVRLFSSKPYVLSTTDDTMPINLMDRIPVFETPTTTLEFSNEIELAPSPPPSPPPPPDGGFHWIGSGNKTLEVLSDESNLKYGRRYQPVVASERLAKAHIDDVLSLTLELEKAKQSLETEQMRHDETKSALVLARAKNAQAESQIETLLNEMETNRENDARKIRELEAELRRERLFTKEAEEDAELALKLAKENSHDRIRVEELLSTALDEIQYLREHVWRLETSVNEETKNGSNAIIASKLDGMNKRTEVQNTSDTSNSKPSRTMIAAGLEISQQYLNWKDGREFPLTIDESIKAATDLSKLLRSRLKAFEEKETLIDAFNGNDTTVPSSSSLHSPRRDFGSAVEALEVCRRTVDVLKESGKRLQLTGRWWTAGTDVRLDEIHLESLARHFCMAVEVELERKHRDIVELESLVSIWEKGTTFD